MQDKVLLYNTQQSTISFSRDGKQVLVPPFNHHSRPLTLEDQIAQGFVVEVSKQDAFVLVHPRGPLSVFFRSATPAPAPAAAPVAPVAPPTRNKSSVPLDGPRHAAKAEQNQKESGEAGTKLPDDDDDIPGMMEGDTKSPQDLDVKSTVEPPQQRGVRERLRESKASKANKPGKGK
jgi:hypothetical protein